MFSEKEACASVNDDSVYSLTNTKDSLRVDVVKYGATITNVFFNGLDVVLGFDDLSGYLQKLNPHFGAAIGRCANRIENGSFNLNGQKYELAKNNNGHHLHGGLKGFDMLNWVIDSVSNDQIVFKLISNHGDEGYPGTVEILLKYQVTEDDELVMEYEGSLINDDKETTILNLTNHTYFNLNGFKTKNNNLIYNHLVTMKSDKFLETSIDLIPTGQVVHVKDKPVMDFTISGKIGDKIHLVEPFGFDHCYVLDSSGNSAYNGSNEDVREAATVVSEESGIKMTFSTSEPGFQFYTGNFISDQLLSKSTQVVDGEKQKLGKHSGFCLEASRFPNAINNELWRDSVILKYGNTYRQKTIYRFSLL